MIVRPGELMFLEEDSSQPTLLQVVRAGRTKGSAPNHDTIRLGWQFHLGSCRGKAGVAPSSLRASLKPVQL